ncbi:MAG: porin family protein [Balneolaceae bacterium]|nr:porin family protein [Balneolaceae bacterium]
MFSLFGIACQDRSFGIKGGAAAYQITNDVGSSSSTSDRKIGFEAGIFGEFPINRLLSIQPEAVFVQKGGEETSEQFGNSSITLNYVDVPLLLKINAPVDGMLQPYIFGGPYAGYLIEATSETESESMELTEFLNEFHYGLKVGLGINIGSFLIDARYDMGLANIYKEDEELEGIDSNFEITTAGFILSVGLRF